MRGAATRPHSRKREESQEEEKNGLFTCGSGRGNGTYVCVCMYKRRRRREGATPPSCTSLERRCRRHRCRVAVDRRLGQRPEQDVPLVAVLRSWGPNVAPADRAVAGGAAPAGGGGAVGLGGGDARGHLFFGVLGGSDEESERLVSVRARAGRRAPAPLMGFDGITHVLRLVDGGALAVGVGRVDGGCVVVEIRFVGSGRGGGGRRVSRERERGPTLVLARARGNAAPPTERTHPQSASSPRSCARTR